MAITNSGDYYLIADCAKNLIDEADKFVQRERPVGGEGLVDISDFTFRLAVHVNSAQAGILQRP